MKKIKLKSSKKLYSENDLRKAQQAILCNHKDALSDKNFIIYYLNSSI